jgi:6-phosphogluconolactonase
MTPSLFKQEDEILESILLVIRKVLETKDFFRLCLSGGTSLQKTLKLFSKTNIPWERIVIYQTDERITSLDSEDSNYFCLLKFFKNNNTITQPFYNGKSLVLSLASYQRYLNLYCNYEDCAFDLLLLGFGEDGHIASLFDAKHVESKKDILIVYQQSYKYQRISLSLERIKQSNTTIIISYGQRKYNIMTTGSNKNLPINVFLENQKNVQWYHKF